MKPFLICLICIFLSAQDYTIQAHKRNLDISIDGMVEPAWMSLPSYNNFVQFKPFPNEKPTYNTSVRFTYDEKNIYFFVEAFIPDSNLITQSGKRDLNNDRYDQVTIYIRPTDDETTAYCFTVNPSNVQKDEIILKNGAVRDLSWNAIWESSTTREKNKWVAEFKIPLKELKYQNKQVQHWGANFERYIRSKNEYSYWKALNPDVGLQVSNFGNINGIEGLKSYNELEVQPSLVGTMDFDRDYDISKTNRPIGLNLKYNVDQEHSLYATINPDFSQVEADAEYINITSYPLKQKERRPFFIKTGSFYQLSNTLYTRRFNKPRAGVNFKGSSNAFQYGIMYLNNSDKKDTGSGVQNLNENVVLSKVKYVPSENFSAEYLGSYIASTVDTSGDNYTRGSAHGVALYKRLSEKFDMRSNVFTTQIKDKTKDSFQGSFEANFKSDPFLIAFQYFGVNSNFDYSFMSPPDLVTNVQYAQFRGEYTLRFKKEDFIQSITFGSYVWKEGLFNWKESFYGADFRTTVRTMSKFLGSTSFMVFTRLGSRFFRIYEKWDDIYQIEGRPYYTDNHGKFQLGKQNMDRIRLELTTDFSKPIGLFINGDLYNHFQSRVLRSWFYFNVKLSDRFIWNPGLNIVDIRGSRYMTRRTERYYNSKFAFSPTENLNLNYFFQYLDRSQGVYNNFVLSYEFKKGCFAYFAWNEVGENDFEYKEGPIFDHYKLNKRVISLKLTYSFSPTF